LPPTWNNRKRDVLSYFERITFKSPIVFTAVSWKRSPISARRKRLEPVDAIYNNVVLLLEDVAHGRLELCWRRSEDKRKSALSSERVATI
jgi:hypothetical protein